MDVLCRWILVLTLLLAAEARLAAASAADRAFDAAVKAFQDTIYNRAEAQLGEFCQKFPASSRLPEAVLLQAQARIKLTNSAGAIDLLKANQGKAGTNADQYLFWLGKAYSGKGDWPAAGDTFASLLSNYPSSPRCLEASIEEAAARSALARTEPAQWQRVVRLLQQTNSVFQEAVRTNAASELVPLGRLLLSEAQLATKDYRAAEETLQPLAQRLLNPKLAWQWQYLLCRIQVADGRTNAALQGTTNLLSTAANSAQTNLLAESAAFRAGLLERLGRTNEAIAAYKINLPQGIPPERQRQALLKIIELYLAQNDIPQAAQTLEQFLGQFPDAASADLAWLTLGELRLRQYETEPGTHPITPAATNAPATTNGLYLASQAFSTLVKQFPHSPLLGKAQLDLGWCYLRAGELAKAEAALKEAVTRPLGAQDLAKAYFRLADAQFQQTNFTGAIKSYRTLVEQFANTPEVRTNLFEPALYQTVRAGLLGGDLNSATNALQNLRTSHARSLSTARAVLLTAQNISRRGDAPAARKILLDFDKDTPGAALQAERQLAVAATWEQERRWPEAIAEYNSWLQSFTNHDARPRAEYFRARDTSFQSGRATNALALYSAFVAHYPTNEFAPFAQMWIADYYYNNLHDYFEAERNYKVLFQSTNWPPSELTYQAQLMAGLAAIGRQGWNDVKAYLPTLYNNTNGPSDEVRFQALFEYGGALMQMPEPAESNRLANCEQAIQVFGLVGEKYGTNRLALRAWVKRGNCYLQWALARQLYDSLTNSLNAYQRVIDSPQADVELRSEAKVGLALTLEKWANQKTGKEQSQLLEQALNHCLDVVYGKVLRDDEQPVPYWTNEAGLRAFRLADTLQAWSQEVRIFERLTNSVWPNPPAWMVKQAAKARENLSRQNDE